MPLTPLHLAVGLPVKKYVSMKAFIITNILIDIEPGIMMFFRMDNLGYPIHQGMHTLIGATAIAGFVCLLRAFPTMKEFGPWMFGAFFGGYSHILLDALVHRDVEPFAPFFVGNPLFLDIHAEVSIACAVILTYYLTKWVESLRIGEAGTVLFQRARKRFFSRTIGK